jgi:hypothetical protein
MIEIKYTTGKSYIRITNPNSLKHNWGYISARTGELSVKPDLMKLISNTKQKKIFTWAKGCGKHGGSGYDFHSINHKNVNESISFIREILEHSNYSITILI